MNKVWERLEAHYDAATKKYGENAVLGVFLYGSQNYNCHTDASDVDTKCILIPNLNILACHPYEVKHLSVDEEICECMSIQHMVANWKKQNINFVEIMFTPYCLINPLYQETWNSFMNIFAERVARYDVYKAILSMANQALHTYKQNPNDFKKQMNMMRIRASLHRIVCPNVSYWNCIHFSDECGDTLREIRKSGTDLVELFEALDDLGDFIDKAHYYKPDLAEQAFLDSQLEEFIVNLIRDRLVHEGFRLI